MQVTKLVLTATLVLFAISAQLAAPAELHGQGVDFGRGPGITLWTSPVVVSRDHSTGFGEGPGIVLPATAPLADEQDLAAEQDLAGGEVVDGPSSASPFTSGRQDLGKESLPK
jgi:hypothetical protein